MAKKKRNVHKQRTPIRKTAKPIRRGRKKHTRKKGTVRKKPKKLVSKNLKVSKGGTHKRRKSVAPVKVQRKSRTVKKAYKLPIEERHDSKDKRKLGNQIVIHLPKGKFKVKLEYIRNLDLTELLSKYMPERTVGFYKGLFATSFQTILRTTKGGQVFERANRFSGFENIMSWFNVTQEDPFGRIREMQGIQEHTLFFMVDYQDNYFERLAEREDDKTMKPGDDDTDWVYDPNRISAIILRIFYLLPFKEPIENPDYSKPDNI